MEELIIKKESTATLADVCEFIIDSEHKTAPTQDSGYPYVRTPNVGRGRIIFENMRYISEEIYRDWTRRGVPKPGDLILAREAPVGNAAIITEGMKPCLGQRTVLLRPNRKFVDPNYLVYFLLDDYVQGKFHGFSIGATVPHLNMSDIRGLDLPKLPELQMQRAIGSILCAYDDLIENNRRRIQLLEEMARALYHEWFVHFRFPEYEDIEMVDSELGKIPEGWKVTNVPDSIELNPKIDLPKTGDKKYVSMFNVSSNSMMVSAIESKEGNTGSKYQNGDTLFPQINPSLQNGKMAYVQFLDESEIGLGTGEFIVMRSKTLCSEFVYLLASTYEFRENAVKSMIGASGRQRVQKECFETFYFPHPNQDTVHKFQKMVSPIFKLAQSLWDINNRCSLFRNLLLPKLVSGQIDVSDIDIEIQPDTHKTFTSSDQSTLDQWLDGDNNEK